MKKWFLLVPLALLAFALGYGIIALSQTLASVNAEAFSSYRAEMALPLDTAPVPAGAVALWVSPAASVPELVAEADLVLRARVLKAPVLRVEAFPGPVVAEDGTVIGEKTDTVAFSDTEMEVIEVYKGAAEKTVMVMQTGGTGEAIAGQRQFALEGDPLYTPNEEVILFLVDISEDAVHAQGRMLYRVVNPAGRYTLQGAQVLNYAEAAPTLPKTVEELVAQIREAVEK